jgi:isoquinoline 1-oxidoreductase beta subunit
VTGVPAEKVKAHTTFLGGGFGAKTEQLCTAEAAMLAKLMDKPVKVIWSREDDVRHGAYRPLTAQHMAAVIEDGKVSGWSHRLVADSVLLRARKVVWDKSPGLDGSVAVGQIQPYAIPNKHHEYIHRQGGIPVGYWNAVGNGFTVFAAEAFLDEVAHRLHRDPLQLRLELITDRRGKSVIETVARMARWGEQRPSGRALGMAYNNGARWNSQIAEVVEVSVDRASGEIAVHKVWAAVDPAMAIQPRHLVQQIETGIIWGLSAALRERVTIVDGEVQQSNFHDYPVMRMAEVPEIEIQLVDNGVREPSGVGQIGVPPVAPAISNAVFALTGARIRRIPMLPAVVKRAFAELGQKGA